MRLIALAAFAVLLATTAAFSTTAFAAPALTVTPVVGHPKIPTTVSGTGFTANEAVDVYFDTTEEFLAFTNASGGFAAHGFGVPANALPGTHWITAVGRKNGDGLQKSFNVRTDWTQYGFDLQHRGRNPYENVVNGSNVGTLDVAWSYAAGEVIFGSAMVFGNVVYFGSDNGKLYALTTKGAVKWTATTGGTVESTPAYAGTNVYVGSGDGKVYAFNWQTGALKWSAATGGGITSSPAVVGNTVYIGSSDNRVYALNATTGAALWSTATESQILYSSPAVANGIVYIGSSDDKLYALNADTGAVLWTIATGNAIFSSPAIASGAVFFGSGDSKVYAVNASTGAVIWTYTTGAGVVSSPAVVNNTVFIGSNDGNLYALDAGTGLQKWATPVGVVSVGAVSIANGVGYVGVESGKRVYAFDLDTGHVLWSGATVGNVESRPAVADGKLYISSVDGSLYAYALDGGSNPAYKKRSPPSYASLHPDRRLKPLK